MLDDLGGFINSFGLFNVLSVFLGPGGELLGSGGGLVSESALVLLDVLGGLSDLLFSLIEGSGGILTELGDSNNLGLVVNDFTLHVIDELFTCGCVVLVNLVRFVLLLVQVGGQVLEEKVDLVDGLTSLGSKLHQ